MFVDQLETLLAAISIVLATLGGTATMFVWFSRRTDRRFEQVDRDIKELRDDLGEVKVEVGDMKVAIARLEGRLPQFLLPR